jgi:hypothetical protein
MYKWHKVISKDATVDDTLHTVIDFINDYSKSAFIKAAAKEFGPVGDKKAYMERVYDWITSNIDYKEDFPGVETIFTPQLTVLFKKADCKKQTILAACILNAAGITPVLKHVYYSGRSDISHIYTIVPFPTLKNYIAFDTTLKRMGDEVDYATATLYFLNGESMEVHTMGNSFDGVISRACMGFAREFNTVSANVHRHIPHALKPRTFIAPSSGKDAAHFLLPGRPGLAEHLVNVPAAQQRGAFLELIKNNHGGITNMLIKMLGKNPTALDAMWGKIGGDIAALKQTIIESAHVPAKSINSVSGFNLGKLLGNAAGVLTAVAPLAATIDPNVGQTLQNVANTAQNIQQNLAAVGPNGSPLPPPSPSEVPVDTHGHDDSGGAENKILGMSPTMLAVAAGGAVLLLIVATKK